jgi:hypothetical protein
MIEIFRWLDVEYVLPLNISVTNSTTTSQPTTTATTISTTTLNHASLLFGYFNSLFPCFLIILLFPSVTADITTAKYGHVIEFD